MNRLFLALIFIFSSQFSLASKDFPNPQSFIYDYKSRKAIKNKIPEKALQESLKILEHDTDIPQVHSNLGIAFDQLSKSEQAEKSFSEALRLIETAEKKQMNSVSPTDQFQIYYNLGVYYGQKKEIDKALAFYQSALDVNPTSIETKHNIELLIQSQQQQQKQKSDQEKKDGESGDKDKDKDKDKDQKDNEDDKGEQKKDPSQDRKNTPKYQPRAFKGDQLGEADVKKILGELSQQDRKIRAQYNKKEQQRENRNAKDW